MGGAWQHFIDELHLYIFNYIRQDAYIGKKKISIAPVDYSIKNANVLVEKNWELDLIKSKTINDLMPELNVVALEYLPKFKAKYPQYRNDECFKF